MKEALSRRYPRHNPSSSLHKSSGTSFPSRDLHYSLWHYSTERITIGLRMQERRRQKSVSITAEKVFGSVLREIRKERELSQESLAFESGYHATYIGQLERGQKS